ncbi:MAG: poly-gamma-glutamate biosynthesis protein PgsC [candidate division WOR-3 bacterium]
MIASFVMTEAMGLAAGGIVVPGYFAIALGEPQRVVATLAVALAVYLISRILSNWMLLHGRRLLIFSVLLGYLLGYATRLVPPIWIQTRRMEIQAIGYAIPGLIAYWMSRQGAVETISTLLFAAVLTRLVVIVISGGSL